MLQNELGALSMHLQPAGASNSQLMLRGAKEWQYLRSHPQPWKTAQEPVPKCFGSPRPLESSWVLPPTFAMALRNS